MKVELVAFLSVVSLSGCGMGAPVSLKEAAPSGLSVDATPEDGGLSQLSVTLTYPPRSGCPALDGATATLNGVALKAVSLGGVSALNSTGKTQCVQEGRWAATGPIVGTGAGKLVISDASEALTLDLPTLLADRMPRLAHLAATPTGSVVVTWPVADDTVTVSFAQLRDKDDHTADFVDPPVTSGELRLAVPVSFVPGPGKAFCDQRLHARDGRMPGGHLQGDGGAHQ